MHRTGYRVHLLVCLNRAGAGDNGQLLATNLHTADIDYGVLRVEHTIGPFKRLLHPHDLLHTIINGYTTRVQRRSIANNTKNSHGRTDNLIDLEMLLHQHFSNFVFLVLWCTRLENNNHGCNNLLLLFYILLFIITSMTNS